jgi:hypothetical protein
MMRAGKEAEQARRIAVAHSAQVERRDIARYVALAGFLI